MQPPTCTRAISWFEEYNENDATANSYESHIMVEKYNEDSAIKNLKKVQSQTPMRAYHGLRSTTKNVPQKVEKCAIANSHESLSWFEEYNEEGATTHFNESLPKLEKPFHLTSH